MLPCRVYLIRQTNIAFSFWWSEETRKQSALVCAVEGSGGEGRRVWVYLLWVAVPLALRFRTSAALGQCQGYRNVAASSQAAQQVHKSSYCCCVSNIAGHMPCHPTPALRAPGIAAATSLQCCLGSVQCVCARVCMWLCFGPCLAYRLPIDLVLSM